MPIGITGGAHKVAMTSDGVGIPNWPEVARALRGASEHVGAQGGTAHSFGGVSSSSSSSYAMSRSLDKREVSEGHSRNSSSGSSPSSNFTDSSRQQLKGMLRRMKRAVGDGSLYYGDYGLFSELVTLCGKFGVSSDGLSFKDFASTISSSTMRKMLGFLETAMKVLGTPGEFQVPLRNARESLEDHRLREDLGMER